MMRVFVCACLMILLAPGLCKKRDGPIHQLYGVNFSKFLKTHPISLFVLYDTSPLSESVVLSLKDLDSRLKAAGHNIAIAKMSLREAPSYPKLWNAFHLPHLRFYIGDGIYDDMKSYPTLDSVYNWITTILTNDDTVTVIDNDKKVDQFNEEPFAFYLRFPGDQEKYIALLKKLRKLDNGIKVFYSNRAEFDAFESYNPKDLVVGFKTPHDHGNKFLASPRKINADTVHSFFQHFRYPEVYKFTKDVMDDIINLKTKTMIFFDIAKRGEIFSQFKRAAHIFKNAMRFTFADLKEDLSQSMAQKVMVDAQGNLPQIRIIDEADGKTRVFKVTAANEDDFANAIDAYSKGKLEDLLNKEVISAEL